MVEVKEMLRKRTSCSSPVPLLFINTALAACGGASPATDSESVTVDINTPDRDGSHDIDVMTLTIVDIQRGLKDHRFTAEELTRAYLDQIARWEPDYNAFTFQNAGALDRAREMDRRMRHGDKVGPLAGVPIVIKESMDWVGFPSTAGWAPFSSQAGGIDLFPLQNSVVVDRMLDAGVIPLGKTNIPAFSDDNTRANSSWAGPTFNAVDRTLAPGASSSGTATAVAGGFAPAGLAEETGGSIQSPSAAQSLVGVKPTFALVPTAGVVPLAGTTRDVVGPIATTVRDAAMILDVLAGFSPRDPKTAASNGHVPRHGYTSQLSKHALRGKRFGLYGAGWNLFPLSEEVSSLYQHAITEVVGRGATVVADPFAGTGFAELAMPDVIYDPRGTESVAFDFNSYLKGLGVDGLDALRELLPGHVTPLDVGGPLNYYSDILPQLKESLKDPTQPPDLTEFHALRDQYLSIFTRVMAANHLDGLVFPQAVEVIPPLFSSTFIQETTVSAINIAGLPGVIVPAGRFANGAPFSLIFVGAKWSEADLLGFAYDYEQATHHRVPAHLTPGN